MDKSVKKNDKTFQERLRETYRELLANNTAQSPLSVAWNTKESQEIRFRVLAAIADLKNSSVLDVGSGLGDFYAFIDHYQTTYTGIELSEDLYKASLGKYSAINLIHGDFLSHVFRKHFDYVVCSGAFNAKQDEYHEEYVFSAVKKMFELAIKGIAFNLPSSLCEEAKDPGFFDEELAISVAYMDPAVVFSYCKSIAKWVTLRHDYLPHDFTIYMYK